MAPSKLIILIKNAKLTRDTDTFGKMDPYVEIEIGTQKQKTSIKEGTGKNPTFNEQFIFYIDKEENIQFQVLEDDGGSFDLVGGAILPIAKASQKIGKTDLKIPLKYENQDAGTLFLTLEWKPSHNIKEHQLSQSNIQDSSLINGSQLYQKGTIEISNLRGYLMKDDQLFDKLDPYIKIKVNKQEKKTSICEDGGKKPIWKGIFYFQRKNNEENIEFSVFDSDGISKDDFIGEGKIKISEYLGGGKFRSQQCQLSNEEIKVGDIYFDIEYLADPLKKQPKVDLLDMKEKIKAEKGPTLEEQKKQEMLKKRKELLKSNVIKKDEDLILPRVKNNASSLNMKSMSQSNIHSISYQSPKIKKHKIDYVNDLNYRNYIYHYGQLSHIQSASTLQNSSKIFSIPKGERFKSQIYEGYQSYLYVQIINLRNSFLQENQLVIIISTDEPHSDFNKKPLYKAYTPSKYSFPKYKEGKQQFKGFSFGIGDRPDLTKPFQNTPGPGSYQGPIMRTRFSELYGLSR